MRDSCDVVVVGGGIHGVGVAQAAAAAGHSVLLLEKSGLAAATSGRSSKLIHGGLRYLEGGHFSLVRESLQERALLLRLAPDLVSLKRFVIPIYRTTRRRPWKIRAGLSLYAALGGFGGQFRFGTVPRSEWEDLDGLNTDGLEAVFWYLDGQTDDALLTAAVMRSAQGLGAELALPARFTGAEIGDDGCDVRYVVGDASGGGPGNERACRARVLVNAAGPWVHDVLEKVTPAQTPVSIQLVQGAHILVAGTLARGLYYVESPHDGRAVFVMPRDGGVLVGTTEVAFGGRDPAQVEALASEKTYLTGVLQRYFPRLAPRRPDDILDAWAGIRVLPAAPGDPFKVSRETILATDRGAGTRRGGTPRLLTIYGGKLTTYRSTAAKVMRRISGALPAREPTADTRELELTPRR